MITKFAKDLVPGDIFIDTQREGRRPARVEKAQMTMETTNVTERRMITVLNDWTGLSAWSASYDPIEQLEIITPEKAMELTQQNYDEYAQSYMKTMGVTREEYDRRHREFMASLERNEI